jgi:hypothetical protein
MLFPLWNIGLQGLVLWFLVIILLIFSMAKEIGEQNNVYLLSNKRLIHLKYQAKNNYKIHSFIRLLDINKIYKNKHNLCIVSKNKKYYLNSIDLADKLYKRLNHYIKT